jgi:hypothetical protein
VDPVTAPASSTASATTGATATTIAPTRRPTSFPLGLLIGGEELHNNHHTFATSAKLSSKWYEVRYRLGLHPRAGNGGAGQVKKRAPAPKFAKAS